MRIGLTLRLVEISSSSLCSAFIHDNRNIDGLHYLKKYCLKYIDGVSNVFYYRVSDTERQKYIKIMLVHATGS